MVEQLVRKTGEWGGVSVSDEPKLDVFLFGQIGDAVLTLEV